MRCGAGVRLPRRLRLYVVPAVPARSSEHGFRRGLAGVWLAWLQHGDDTAPALLQVYRQMGMVAADTGVDTLRQHLLPVAAPVLRWATEPLTAATFDFSHKQPLPLPAQDAWSARQGAGLLRLPPELPSFDRAWLGLMHALQGLKARVDTRAARALVQAAAVQGADQGAPP